MTQFTIGVPRDPTHLRELNKALVRNILRRDGSLTRTDLARTSGLTKPTVSAIIRELVEAGEVVTSATSRLHRSSGVIPQYFEYNRLSRLFVGVQVGVQITDVVLDDGLGDTLGFRRTETPIRDPHRALTGAAAAARQLLREHDLDHDLVMGVGVCLPGMVDTELGRCLLAPNLGWRNIDVASYFAALGQRVVVNNVIHAALEAEHNDGAATGVSDAVMLFEDNGVGAALMSRGVIFSGSTGLAGELGHCKLRGLTDVCGCGAIGCLETQVSAQAVARRAAGLLHDDFEGSGVFGALATSPDPTAEELLRQVGRELGEGAAWVVNIVNPRLLLLGGSFAAGGPALLEGVAESLHGGALPEMCLGLDLRAAGLGHHAATRGAALLARRAIDGLEGTR